MGYDNTGASYGGGAPYEVQNARGATFTSRPADRSLEGKAAKKFIESISSLSFDIPLFCNIVAHTAGTAVNERILTIIKGLLRHYAVRWDCGDLTDSNRDAKRMVDTMIKYKM